ncbi:lanthionine synthetase LanC family protein [candidate division KSB1 bacterium]
MNSVSVPVDNSLFWPSQPDTMSRGETTLYHGVPGGALFYLELYKATGKDEYRITAEKAAEWLISKAHHNDAGYYWSDYVYRGTAVSNPGLYTGTAGVGSVFLEFSRYLNMDKYYLYARGAVDHLAESILSKSPEDAWNNSYDIISGSAGTGLFMIRAYNEFSNPEYLAAAKKAGDILIEAAIADEPGKKWTAGKGQTQRIYPNFSHGTAGSAYFLAALYSVTEENRYLNSALEGAEWLIEHEEDHGVDGHAWYHHEPDGKDLYYVGWCHGPGGTARLFYQLYTATGDEKWINLVRESAEWLMSCGLGEKPLEGYWNVSVCCGDAGIADFYADIYHVTGEEEYLNWAVSITEELIKKSTPGNPGLKWVQAENRTRPAEVFAQTGFSQGSAGIGLLMLKMYNLSSDNTFPVLTMPDSPFIWN